MVTRLKRRVIFTEHLRLRLELKVFMVKIFTRCGMF